MDTNAAGAGRPTAPDPEELRLLADQLTRMRGMLFGYSDMFFRRIRDWALVAMGLLLLGTSGLVPVATAFVPFIVPFAFLETGYLFFYTVFARRHAEYLEREINARLGHDVLVAHRLEAAYLYPPDAPKIAAFSFGNPTGMTSAATLGYTVGAGLLWIAGMVGLVDWVRAQGVAAGLAAVLPFVAVAWTLAIAGHLVYAFLGRREERRLLAELERAYPRAGGGAASPGA
jgi:hypothetical protein